MNAIEHIFEPTRLFLVWHRPLSSGAKSRRVVGELVRHGNDALFRYLKGTKDFDDALLEGFYEFPAFADTSNSSFTTGALDVFLKRLPPRKREDFREYLAQYNLPPDFQGSDFALLGYTGAKLPSDTFELCPDLSDAEVPLDFVIEAVGLSHHLPESIDVSIGDQVELEEDLDNPHDENAIRIVYKGQKIGFINRALALSFKRLLERGTLDASIVKFSASGPKKRLLILVRFN